MYNRGLPEIIKISVQATVTLILINLVLAIMTFIMGGYDKEIISEQESNESESSYSADRINSVNGDNNVFIINYGDNVNINVDK